MLLRKAKRQHTTFWSWIQFKRVYFCIVAVCDVSLVSIIVIVCNAWLIQATIGVCSERPMRNVDGIGSVGSDLYINVRLNMALNLLNVNVCEKINGKEKKCWALTSTAVLFAHRTLTIPDSVKTINRAISAKMFNIYVELL